MSTPIPTLVRARKLLAFLSPDSGAAETERVTARVKLDELLAETGLRLEDLIPAKRTKRTMILRHDREDTLAFQIACWIADSDDLGAVGYYDHLERPARNGKVKRLKVRRFEVNLSDAEYADWLQAVAHYMPLFRKLRKDLEAQLKAARMALKYSLHGFVAKFEIYPDREDDGSKSRLTPEQRAAAIAALRATEGKPWKRPACRLGDGQISLPLC